MNPASRLSPTQPRTASVLQWRRLKFWTGGRFGWLEAGFLVLLLLALAMRLWELGGRAMHYDEAIHVYYAWRLSNLEEYIHSPWMHGPFQIEYTALMFRLFGDSDFTARLGYVFFGVALAATPYFLRDYLGRAGALFTAIMLTLSPALLYFSRFGRNDILMAFWAATLFILLWRYIHQSKNRHLYLASAVLAFMFATKETAYLVTLALGAVAFLLALPDLVPCARRRARFSHLSGAAGFFLLLVTLTLPQWSALAALFQEPLGLALANSDGVPNGLVGAPQWESPYLVLPVYAVPWWGHALAVLLLAGLLALRGWRRSGVGRDLAVGILTPLAVVAATLLLLFRPLGGGWDLVAAGALTATVISLGVYLRYPWHRETLLLLVPFLLTLVYVSLFTGIVDVATLLGRLLPSGIPVDTSVNGIPKNYLVAGGILSVTTLVSGWLGLRWRGGTWLTCAAIFYLVWVTLYTTFFTNLAGFFSGVWQGMGYWVAQQEVARGNQPWYYYFVGLSVYELLPVLFGIIGALYFLKRGDILGLALTLWAGLTFLGYTVASEKMPWLLVNITLPLVFLAGKYLGDLADRISWRRVRDRGQFLLLALPPLGIAAGVYLLRHWLDPELALGPREGGLAVAVGLVAVASAFLVRLAPPRSGVALAGLGAAVLLLGLGVWGGVRAAYTFDDTNVEILVYAQGGADLARTSHQLEEEVFTETSQPGAVRVDYDMWYPFQWYVRHQEEAGTLQFGCFKDQNEGGWNASCRPAAEDPGSRAYLLTDIHGTRDSVTLDRYQQAGPLRNLLWFPESYRRPGENRQAEGWSEELSLDLHFFQESASRRETWLAALDYLLFRDLERDWYTSEYYAFWRSESEDPG